MSDAYQTFMSLVQDFEKATRLFERGCAVKDTVQEKLKNIFAAIETLRPNPYEADWIIDEMVVVGTTAQRLGIPLPQRNSPA